MTTETETNTENSKRKRSIRNRERLVSHQTKLLDNFIAGVIEGYSEENWSKLSKFYIQLSEFLSLDEYKTIGELWRNSYSDNISSKDIERTTKLIKLNMISNLPLQ